MKTISLGKILLLASIVEVCYLSLSFAISQRLGQWSITGELIRTGLRLLVIGLYSYLYFRYFKALLSPCPGKKRLNLLFITSVFLLLLFGAAYTNAGNETAQWQFVFAASGLVAGFREELFYRGMVQNSLRSKTGDKNAILIAALLFTISHVQYLFYGQLTALAFIAMAGIIFGCIFFYTRSIRYAALIHGSYDAVLSVKLLPYKLNDMVALLMFFLILLAFWRICNIVVASSPWTEQHDG